MHDCDACLSSGVCPVTVSQCHTVLSFLSLFSLSLPLTVTLSSPNSITILIPLLSILHILDSISYYFVSKLLSFVLRIVIRELFHIGGEAGYTSYCFTRRHHRCTLSVAPPPLHISVFIFIRIYLHLSTISSLYIVFLSSLRYLWCSFITLLFFFSFLLCQLTVATDGLLTTGIPLPSPFTRIRIKTRRRSSPTILNPSTTIPQPLRPPVILPPPPPSLLVSSVVLTVHC